VGCECTEGGHYYVETQSIKGFQPEIIDALIERDCHFLPRFHQLRSITFMEPSRVGASETAFALRQDHLMVS